MQSDAAATARLIGRDGVSLAVVDLGRGDPPLLFVHGWACDHTVFGAQVDHFVRRGHRVVLPDLRGHGASDTPRQRYTITSFADDLAALCDRLAVRRPVIVGHSMGGVVAFDLAVRYSDLVAAVVLLDAPLFPSPELIARGRASIAQLAGPDYTDAMHAYVTERLFLATDELEVRERVAEMMASPPQHVLLVAQQAVYDYTPDVPAGSITVPVLAVQAASGAVTGVERLRVACRALWLGQTVGAGHFHQMLVPEQVNAMIERFLSVASAPRST
jgi:pimeloyl-ACP methyl ester carboxylesterase